MKEFIPKNYLDKKLNLTQIKNFKAHKNYIESKSILGIDIYRYSKYPFDQQVYIPVLFDQLYDFTVDACSGVEKFVYQKYENTLATYKEHFISTGDGGFQIFNNPLECLVFAAYFQLNVRCFNTGNLPFSLFQNLYKLTGPIELRYCITTDDIYKYSSNYFGPGIINNARILAKDNLNRVLIDSNSIRWFDSEINTIENLLVMKIADFKETKYFKRYNSRLNSCLFDPAGSNIPIKSIDILKIGNIKSKETDLDIYNLHLQIGMFADHIQKHDFTHFLVSLGNMNVGGIN
jgi:hypothetical protein